ncbi:MULTISPECIES: carbohydrate ABC transporter permease [Brevibacillus]|jgi:ABC-type sugar transport systems, permease components|uniref:Sugar ABC transporter permease n=1 Tax=Brevibacillus parabrevis TaxID=54914 RepID=A0A4Y3PI05_BREPA|nr:MULTISPECIES: sugar ABC transporter permease [Brevibacillus]MDH6350417.1 multiple sugar transport system permease protein [Brevibacillus sp. 1238]MDR4998530.1 sugar ABC transporter permease [Brevibacillus parabrevis]MED1725303.1 sugar ABC transporter permease [Brevibacillus parabrevis]MED2258408.1 sugar ABC transporter permease [Brevibacillus parabrevis]RNB95045.1 sugar ABC transporter permease [Brevibacillus parabrevis]
MLEIPNKLQAQPDVKKKRKWLDSEGRWGLLLVSPYLIHFLVFVVGTSLASLYFSFSDYDILNPPKWTGLDNYEKLFADPLFYQALWNTVYFTLLYVPAKTFLALLLAVALNQKLKGLKLFRMAHFLPVISSWTVIAYVADAVFNQRIGFANAILAHFGIAPQSWLIDEVWVIPVLVLIAIWKSVGYMMIIFLAGLQGISNDMYEAASIDGANAWQKFWRVTVPMISGTTFLVIILNTIYSFQNFEQIFVMTGGSTEAGSTGGANNASLVLMLLMFRQGFSFYKMGYASAIAWVLFLILLAITLVQFKLQKKWVHYD